MNSIWQDDWLLYNKVYVLISVSSKGSETVARVDCPYSFLGEYEYTHTDSSGAVTCSAESSSWDMCADNTQMTFDYAQCPTKVAYSGESSF